jgi:hypothetical protein
MTDKITVDNYRLEQYDVEKIAGPNGAIQVFTSGLCIPRHDEEVIDEALAPATTVITYKLAGVTVATKTITVAGTTTTIKMS